MNAEILVIIKDRNLKLGTLFPLYKAHGKIISVPIYINHFWYYYVLRLLHSLQRISQEV